MAAQRTWALRSSRLATMRSVSLGWLDPERCSTALTRIRGLEDLRSNVSNQAISFLSHWCLRNGPAAVMLAGFGMEIDSLCVGKVDSSIRHTTRHLRMNVAKQDSGRESRRSGLSQRFRERTLNTAQHPRQVNVSGWLRPVTWTWIRGQKQPGMPKDGVCGDTDVSELALSSFGEERENYFVGRLSGVASAGAA